MSDNFRTQVAEEASSRYPQTSQDVEFNAFTQGASWAFATHATAAGIREAVKAELDACCEWLRTSDPGCAHPEWRRERATRLYLARRVVPAALNTEPEGPANPSGYAYRYHDYSGSTYIKFNGGEEVNGSSPIEAVPYWFAPPSVPTVPPTPETPTEVAALRDERFVAGQNRVNQLWVDALDPSTQVPF